MKPGDLRAFWRDRKGWPVRDLPGTIFLGRAIHETGEALFPGEWTGAEPVAFIPAPLTPLAANPPVYPGRSLAAHRGGDAPRPTIDADDWAGRVQRRLEQIEAQKPGIADATAAVMRWSAVREKLLGWLLAGEIGFAVRFDNGAHAPAVPAAWNAAKADEYFTACRLPFSNGWSSVMLLVDLDENDFRAALSRLKPPAPAVKASAVTGAAGALAEVMRASPDVRTHTNADLEALCGLSGRPFAEAKRRAIDATGATAWAGAGRPKIAAGKSLRE